MKQVIVVRKDLKMGKGKICAQVAHASLEAFLRAREEARERWLKESAKKVVVKVYSEEELLSIFKRAKEAGLPVSLIKDAGRTQILPGTATAVGIGPEEDEKVDKITGHLKLL